MTNDDAKKLVKMLGGLFPNQLTQEQARFAYHRFREFERADVERAIKQHREHGATKDGFIDWKNLFEGCRAAAKSLVRTAEDAKNEGSWCDVYRRQRSEFVGKSDYEVVLRIHRGWWFRSGRTDGSRTQFRSSCVNLLVSCGMDAAAAAGWAEAMLDPSSSYFSQCLDELRGGRAA